MDSRPSTPSTLLFRLCGIGLLVTAFIAYALYRQTYIGACDWFGYFELGRLLGHGRIFLDTPLPIETYPSLVPLGFSCVGAHAVPQYPPGYPLLLAVAGWVGATSFVNPLIGVASIALLYRAARDFAEPWIALAVAAMWAFLPIVVFGSTTFMSDLFAALPVLGAYTLYRGGRLRTSALLLGFSLWVRPTNALFAIAFTLPLLRDRCLIRYVCWTIPAVLPYALYNQLVYGSALRTGYGSIAHDLTGTVFWPFLGFYLWQTALHLGPLVPFALLGLGRGRRSELVFLGVWIGVYILFYSFWRSGGDAWWWIRFLLPGTAPLFLLAANGLQLSADSLRPRWNDGRARRLLGLALGLLVVGTIWFQIALGVSHRDLWYRNKGHDYYDVVRATEEFAPAGAYIGSVEFGGTIRLYTRCHSFVSTHANAAVLIHDLQEKRQPVFLIVEPWNREEPNICALLAANTSELLREVKIWGDVRIYRLTPRSP